MAADLIQHLVNYFEEVQLEDFHPVGFSLGGQVAGHLGNHLEGQLPRITGLDPAGALSVAHIQIIKYNIGKIYD